MGVGHRVVHGGRRFQQPARITEDVLTYLRSLSALAPNHQPPCLLGITTLQHLRPQLPQVACFDTAFHHDRPAVEQRFALPDRPELEEVCRYGFHGLSYDYIAKVLPDHLGAAADGRVIVAHLGHGASLCAMYKRRSIATTMTFTPLDGIPMGTRCGSIDPAVVLYLLQQGMSAECISDLLYFQSGLLGVSGESSDMPRLLDQSSEQARQAVEQFVHHTVRAIGSLAAALGGVDEAETGSAATAWHSNKFLDPQHDGAVLPILHLNGYKIANPTVLARISRDELVALFEGYGYTPYLIEGADPQAVHQAMAATLDRAVDDIHAIQQAARQGGRHERPRWPMIILRTPKGWTCPKEIDGLKLEDYWRAQPGAVCATGGKARAPPRTGTMDEELPARGPVR